MFNPPPVFVHSIPENDRMIQVRKDLRRSLVKPPAQSRVSSQVRPVHSWLCSLLKVCSSKFRVLSLLLTWLIFLKIGCSQYRCPQIRTSELLPGFMENKATTSMQSSA